MNKVKAQGNVAAGPKKTKAEKPKTKGTEADKTAKTADTSSADKPADKTKAAPKSASQSSISHFSSVSTPEYRSGWESIFGGSKSANNRSSNSTNGEYFPEYLSIIDEDIDEELRNILFKAFQRQAKKQGVNFANIKKLAVFEFSISCSLKGK